MSLSQRNNKADILYAHRCILTTVLELSCVVCKAYGLERGISNQVKLIINKLGFLCAQRTLSRLRAQSHLCST
jgi:hypothetical protein